MCLLDAKKTGSWSSFPISDSAFCTTPKIRLRSYPLYVIRYGKFILWWGYTHLPQIRFTHARGGDGLIGVEVDWVSVEFFF
jgi:hypothetical protein